MSARCPFCKEPGISSWFKFAFLANGRPKCEHCGNRPHMTRLVFVWDFIGVLLILAAIVFVLVMPDVITFAALAAVIALVIFVHCLFPFVKAHGTRK